jgi:ABC-type sugar transport system ATPase subunit
MENAMAEAPLLEVCEVSKAFGGVQAVAGACFTLRPGDLQAVSDRRAEKPLFVS